MPSVQSVYDDDAANLQKHRRQQSDKKSFCAKPRKARPLRLPGSVSTATSLKHKYLGKLNFEGYCNNSELCM